METHFVLIDRGVVYTTERRRRQVFPGCVFWVVFNGVQFYLSRQLTQEPWHCGENSACIFWIPRLTAS